MSTPSTIRRVVVAAAVIAATTIGVAAPVHALPMDRERQRTITTVWHHTEYGWVGYSDYGAPQQIASNPSELYDNGQSNADGTITTWHKG